MRSNPFTQALGYARERRLELFLEDPDVATDTNHLERALSVIPTGTRNWLFTWTELGAKHVGIIQSLLTTCRLHEINPYGPGVALQKPGFGDATERAYENTASDRFP